MAGETSRLNGRKGGRPRGGRDARKVQEALEVDARAVTKVFTADRVLQEIAALAFVDIGDLFHDNGTLRALSHMPVEARRAIAGLKSTKWNKPGTRDGVQEDVVEIKLNSKVDALRMAGQVHGLFEERVTVATDKPLRERIARARARLASGK